jgi:hypothetical protein
MHYFCSLFGAMKHKTCRLRRSLTQELLRPQVTIWYRAPELLLGAKHYTR